MLFALWQMTTRPLPAAQDLHTQSAAAVLARDFSGPDLSYLLLDEEGRVIAQRWDGAERDLPVGSLTKPFLALAYKRTHRSYPRFRCTQSATSTETPAAPPMDITSRALRTVLHVHSRSARQFRIATPRRAGWS